jgi:hypothetical protein
LEIDSMHGFQDREKEAVVLSLIRSNAENEIGFLYELEQPSFAWPAGCSASVRLYNLRPSVAVLGTFFTHSAKRHNATALCW